MSNAARDSSAERPAQPPPAPQAATPAPDAYADTSTASRARPPATATVSSNPLSRIKQPRPISARRVNNAARQSAATRNSATTHDPAAGCNTGRDAGAAPAPRNRQRRGPRSSRSPAGTRRRRNRRQAGPQAQVAAPVPPSQGRHNRQWSHLRNPRHKSGGRRYDRMALLPQGKRLAPCRLRSRSPASTGAEGGCAVPEGKAAGKGAGQEEEGRRGREGQAEGLGRHSRQLAQARSRGPAHRTGPSAKGGQHAGRREHAAAPTASAAALCALRTDTRRIERDNTRPQCGVAARSHRLQHRTKAPHARTSNSIPSLPTRPARPTASPKCAARRRCSRPAPCRTRF